MKKALSVLFCLLMIAVTATPAFAGEKQTITEVRLYVTEPVVGEAPDKTIESAEPDKYTARVRYWIKKLYGNDPVEAFEDGFEYALVLDVVPAEGYKFADVQKNPHNFDESPTIVYVNDQKTHCVSAETDAKLGRAYDVTPTSVEPEKPLNFFQRIIAAIKDFFAKVGDFFRKLFRINSGNTVIL